VLGGGAAGERERGQEGNVMEDTGARGQCYQ
jgi:hypothetical protein